MPIVTKTEELAAVDRPPALGGVLELAHADPTPTSFFASAF
jgi:hypothetical protein